MCAAAASSPAPDASRWQQSRAETCGCSLQHAPCLQVAAYCGPLPLWVASLPCRAASTRCLGSLVFLRGVEDYSCHGQPASVAAPSFSSMRCALPAAAAWPACCMEAVSHLASVRSWTRERRKRSWRRLSVTWTTGWSALMWLSSAQGWAGIPWCTMSSKR